MEDTSHYGRVRKATIGEVPTHLADESCMPGDGLIVQTAGRAKQDAEATSFGEMVVRIEIPTPEPWRLAEIRQKRRARSRENWNIVGTFLAILIVIALGLFLLDVFTAGSGAAHAAEITITDAPPKPPTIHAIVTAYTSSVDETDSTPLITADGTHTDPGTIACPAQYAFGTQVKVGDATYTCRDRMSVKFPNRFDVWVHTKAEAFAWGRQALDVEILP